MLKLVLDKIRKVWYNTDMNKSGVYLTKEGGCWVLLGRGGRGAEDQWMPRTNDFDFYFDHIDGKFEWSKDKAHQQLLLDALARKLGLEEVPLSRVRETYAQWEYACTEK